MDKSTFRDGSVLAALRMVVAVRVNIDDVKSVTFEFKVKSVPWLLVIDPHRREKLGEHVGFADPPAVLRLIESAAARLRPPERPEQEEKTDGIRFLYKRTGFSLESADGTVVVDFWTHQMVEAIESVGTQFDGDTLRVRHSRLGLQATLLRRLTVLTQVDFAQDKPLLDAFAEYQITKPVNVRVGRFKVPMGTAFLPRRDFWDFVEPSCYVCGLIPRRDLGAMVYGGGGLSGIFLKYSFGVFTGVQDGYKDADGSKDLAARFTINPFPSDDFDLNLSFGWTGGDTNEPLDKFSISDDSVTDLVRFPSPVAYDGYRYRFSFEGEVLWRNFALGAEYVVQSARIAGGAVSDRFEMKGASAWFAWIVTGEKKSREEWLVPEGTLGALEIVARLSMFRADSGLAPLASSGKFTDGSVQFLAGVNWYPNRYLRLMVDYQHSRFDDPILASGGDLAMDHDTILSSVEVRF